MTAGRPFRVVLVGAESTGKTTLARALAERFGTSWSPEYARAFVTEHGRAMVLEDVAFVGREQIAGEERAIATARAGLVVHDTDILSTDVYSRHYFGASPAEVEAAVAPRRPHLYLLFHPDTPWVAEPGVRGGAHDRAPVHDAFVRAIAGLDVPVAHVRGPWGARTAVAVAAVQAALRGRR
jgi:NadR type nicotinamide-nucleotide adenylyltransferase